MKKKERDIWNEKQKTKKKHKQLTGMTKTKYVRN